MLGNYRVASRVVFSSKELVMVFFIYEICNQMNMYVAEFCIMSCLWFFDMFYIQWHLFSQRDLWNK
jgi:hypothetical protein